MRPALVALLVAASLPAASAEVGPKKVLYVNAYHKGYAWSDGIQTALVAKLEAAGVQVTTLLLDSKTNPAGVPAKIEQARAIIERDKPDVVVVSDDNPVQFLVTPYLKNGSIPVVFCGVNWDGRAHGLPFSNTTGMYEVALVQPMVELLLKHAKGTRVGLLAGDNETSRADGLGFKKYSGQPDLIERYVKDVATWKSAFVEMQAQVDVLLVRNDGLKGWDDASMASWVEQNTRIPTGAIQEEVAPFALATFAKIPAEQGEWAAQAALSILHGTKVSDVLPTRNKKAKVYLNMKLAKVLGTTFDPNVAKRATLIQ